MQEIVGYRHRIIHIYPIITSNKKWLTFMRFYLIHILTLIIFLLLGMLIIFIYFISLVTILRTNFGCWSSTIFNLQPWCFFLLSLDALLRLLSKFFSILTQVPPIIFWPTTLYFLLSLECLGLCFLFLLFIGYDLFWWIYYLFPFFLKVLPTFLTDVF